MTTRSDLDTAFSLRAFYDDQTFERLAVFKPVYFYDDFEGADFTIPTSATAGYAWISKTVKTAGSPTAAFVSNAAGGAVQVALDATSEAQEAVIYFGDQKSFDVTKKLVFEARVNLSTLPSASGVLAVWGLQSSWISGPSNAAECLRFGASGNGAVNAIANDGTTSTSDTTGVTVTAGAWHIYRIDASDVTNVLFFIDGVQVADGVPFAATSSSAILQPYLSVSKPSGTGVGTLQVDYVKIGTTR